MSAKKLAIVIGAGAGGLATANILAKKGYEVRVYEKNATPGGRMNILQKDGFTFDTGPSWYLMKDVFEDYFKLFGKKTIDYYELTRLNPAYKVFFDTIDPVVISGNLKQNLKMFETLEPGASRRLKKYLDRAESNYQNALTYFLYNPFRRYGGLVSKKLLAQLPSFFSMFAQSLHSYTSKHFKRLELQQILEYPSVFLGGSPFSTPALYQLMSYLDFKQGVFYPAKDGMYAVTKALCLLGEELGVKYYYNAPVSKIITQNGRVTGITVRGRTVPADLVISNADLHFTETTLLNSQDRSYPEKYWQKRQAGPSALLLYLGVKGELPELEHHNLFFVKQWKQNFENIYEDKKWPERASVYVSKTTATDTSTAPKGYENIFVLVPLPSGTKVSKDQTKVYVEHYLEQLEQMSGISDLRKRIVSQTVRSPSYFGEAFHSWQNTALGLSHTLRQSAFLRPAVKSKKLSNLFYVGASTQPGIGVPMCLISAQLVYKELIGDYSAGRLSEIRENIS